MKSKQIFKLWKQSIPSNGQPFRVSAKVVVGKRVKYQYVTFFQAGQFMAWLEKNESRLAEVVNVFI